jgi:hypothetical protein
MALLRRIMRLRVAGSLALSGFALLATADTATAQSVPQRMANPYYATSSAAANSAATLAEPQVVYPATTTSVVNAKGLPRDRVAALRAAVRVTTLSEAYRAGSIPTDVTATSDVGTASMNSARTDPPISEPPRFAPAASATQMPTSVGVASTSAVRRDTAVQPVAWLSDAPNATAPPRSPVSPQSTARDLSQVRAVHVGAAHVGNPLRRDLDNGPGNPLR